MSEHERRLVLAIEITTKLERAMPLGAVHEDRDREKIGADRKLAAGENRPGCGAELMRASLTLPKLARLVFVGGIALAPRANGLALGIGPTD